MSILHHRTGAAALALLMLAACGGGPSGNWREEVGRPTANPIVLRPAPPLVVPPVLSLPPPTTPAI